MAVDFDAYIPERCGECPILRAVIRKEVRLVESCTQLIESGIEQGDRSLSDAMEQFDKVEVHARNSILAFIGRCASREGVSPGQIAESLQKNGAT